MRARAAAALVAVALLGAANPSGAAVSAAEACARMAGEGAVEACRRAAAEAPDDIAVLRNLAKSLIAAGDFEATLGVQRDIVRRAPHEAEAHRDLAGTLGFIRRYDEAVEPIETANRLRPGDVVLHQAAALIYANAGRLEEAVRHTRAAAALGDARSMYDLHGFYRDGIGVAADPVEALRWVERAARGGHVKAMAVMAEIYAEGLLGQSADAAKATEWAVRARNARRGE